MAVVDLGPAPLDIVGVTAGDANTCVVSITMAGQPVDLTGYTATAQARRSVTDEVALTATITWVDQASGEFSLGWPGDDVRELLDGKSDWTGVWDLQIAVDTEVTTVAAGKFKARMDVTR